MVFRFVEEGFDRVLIDCDSTLSEIEGIDEMARRKRCLEPVQAITRRAMEGRVDFAESFEERLAIIQPTLTEVQQVGDLYIRKATPGARELVTHLMSAGIEIYIVSGGFRIAVNALAEHLGLSADHVIANDLYFDASGRYEGFNREAPAAKSDGKRLVAENLGGVMAMVGDGASDLEAKEAVDLFIGFCGIERRPIIEDRADVVIYNRNLMSVYPFLLGAHRLQSEHMPVDSHIRINSDALRKAYLAAGLRLSA